MSHVQFAKEQMEHFSQLQREKAKNPVHLDKQAVEECRRVLSAFFAEMTEWEQYMEQAGFEDAQAVPRLLAIWEKYVSEKPRPGYRPLAYRTASKAPTRTSSFWTRSSSPGTSSTSTPERNTLALTAASS